MLILIHLNHFLLILLVLNVAGFSSFADNTEDSIIKENSFKFVKSKFDFEKVKRWADVCQTFHMGAYASFDEMDIVIMDLHYGILLKLIRIANLYYLFDMSFESNLIIPFGTKNDLPSLNIGFGIINYYLRIFLFPIYNVSIFIEGGWGIVGYVNPYPENGTNFNGARQVGGGFKWRINDNDTFVLTVRWYHTSNNDVYGREHNPGVDTIGITAGFDFSVFRKK